LKRLYERWFDFPNLQAADAIHYTSEDERERASFLKLRTPTFVVPNGIDWSRFETLPRRGRFRTRLGIGQAPLILFLGRINFKKGLDLLIRAFDVLRPSIPDARLAIVGPDNEGYGEKVRHWIEERDLREQVDIVDHLNELEALEAFVDADAFVLPSYTENFGITVIEAMACETPVVISDQVNIHREVTSLGAGVVTRCDVDEIARALSDLLSHPEKGRQMGTAGRRAAKNRYTWGPVVEALKEQYEAVASRTRSKY
jgi:glycosyltransferase involved in cell wall biosynthesis